MPHKPLWSGRVDRPDEEITAYMTNVKEDEALILYDIVGSIAHATMLAKQGIISRDEAQQLVDELRRLYHEAEKGAWILRPELEDVHLNVEATLTSTIGEVAKKLHTARSRNDQVNLDMRLYLRDQYLIVGEALYNLIHTLIQKAREHRHVVIPAYTHTRRAQPITAGYYLLSRAYALSEILYRIPVFYSWVNTSPLGACAIAGTSWHIDRTFTAHLLAFEKPVENSLYAISSRGEQELLFLFLLSEIAHEMSKIAADFILYSSDEYRLLHLADEHCTGSSIMPHKKNPDVLELMRARMGVVMGNLSTLILITKNLTTGHHADTQEIKPLVFSSSDTIRNALSLLASIVHKATFVGMETDEYLAATELADTLSKAGIPFREAHHLIGACVQRAVREGKPFREIVEEDATLRTAVASCTPDERARVALWNTIRACFDITYCVSVKETSPDAVLHSCHSLERRVRRTYAVIENYRKGWEEKKKHLLSAPVDRLIEKNALKKTKKGRKK